MENRFQKIIQSDKVVPAVLAFTAWITYWLTSGGTTPYNHFVRLANSFLRGRLDLAQAPPWLEIVPFKGKCYVAYPAMPAIVSILPAAFLGEQLSQTMLAILIGGINVGLSFWLVKKRLKLGRRTAFWIAILLGWSTNHWFLASVGSSWYFAHIVAVFFLLLAILETLGKKRPFLIGLLVGSAYLSRLPTILSFPFFILLITKDKKLLDRILNSVKFLVGLSIFVLFNFWYNYARFGSMLDVGYTLIPGLRNELSYKHGLFSIYNIPKHLKIIFAKLPNFSSSFPFVMPSHVGMALWLTSPAFIFCSLKLGKKLVLASWLTIFLIAIPEITHSTVGFSQFGYRFAMDFTPFLILLSACGIGSRPRWYHKLLICIGVLVNLWGVTWINKLGWVRW